MVGYYGDGAKAVKSGPKLADLIEFLAANTKAEHINILGYSAGATVVVEGIYALRDRHPEMDAAALQKNFRVGNVLLTGADVDLKHFVRKQFARVIDVPEYLQITVSSRDSAMSMSKMLHGGSRLGRANAKELKREEIEQLAKSTKLQVINVTDVKGAHDAAGGFGGHGYWYANPWVSSDVLTMFIWQLPPDQRGLVHVPGKKTWMYPDDYPNRLRAMVTEQVRLMREKRGPATSTAAGQAGAEAR
jgi:esterase/lipase superfamily enzyme